MVRTKHPARSINKEAIPIDLPYFENVGIVKGQNHWVKIDWFKPIRLPRSQEQLDRAIKRFPKSNLARLIG